MTVPQIVSMIVSILSLLGFGTVFSFYWKEHLEKKKSQTEEAKKRAKKDRQDEQREVVSEVVAPLINDLSIIKKGEQANLRHSLYEIYNT